MSTIHAMLFLVHRILQLSSQKSQAVAQRTISEVA